MRPFIEPRCRLHGLGCGIRWGYDPVHTDSDRPYTLDELAARDDGPHRYAYPDNAAYVAGFRLWRALRRDSALTAVERTTAVRAKLIAHGGFSRHLIDEFFPEKDPF